jgi:hypothetical protein
VGNGARLTVRQIRLHLCPSDGRVEVVLREQRCIAAAPVAAERVPRRSRSAEHRSKISWLATCWLMDGVLARNFSHAIWHCTSSVLPPQHVSLTYKNQKKRWVIYNVKWLFIYNISLCVCVVRGRSFDKCPRIRPFTRTYLYVYKYTNLIVF